MATVTFIKHECQSAGALHGVAGYVSQVEKTMQENDQQLVSGQNCNPQLACQEFLTTHTMHRKDSAVYFYHYVQSFHPNEPVTGELAHEVAKEFAARAWQESTAAPSTEPPAPMPEVHPTETERSELLSMFSALYRSTAAQNHLLERLGSKPILYAMKEQADTLTTELTAIRTQLEQAGRPKERRVSLRPPELPLPRLSPALLLIPPILLVSWAAWWSWGTLWSAISTLLP